ncbi:MAG: hypothetical protein ABW208_18540 [Pyrinomonadaceae bacterium]
MAELIQTYAEVVRDAQGEEYTAHAYGEARADGNWEGWIEFHAAAGAVRRTNRETTQPDRDALAYWATGLEPVYLDGAFARAS